MRGSSSLLLPAPCTMLAVAEHRLSSQTVTDDNFFLSTGIRLSLMTIHLESIRKFSLENWNFHAIWISMSSKLHTAPESDMCMSQVQSFQFVQSVKESSKPSFTDGLFAGGQRKQRSAHFECESNNTLLKDVFTCGLHQQTVSHRLMLAVSVSDCRPAALTPVRCALMQLRVITDAGCLIGFDLQQQTVSTANSSRKKGFTVDLVLIQCNLVGRP